MVKFLALIALLWRRRYALILPAFFGAIAGGFYSLSAPAYYESTTTLRMDASRLQSPVLKNISYAEHLAILERTLKNDSVITDTLKETGLALSGGPETKKMVEQIKKSVQFQVINDDLIRINYRSENPQNVKYVLEVLSLNFVAELLAPERFKMDSQLSQLEEQIKKYHSRQKLTEKALEKTKGIVVPNGDEEAEKLKLAEIVSLEFDIQRLEAQRLLAQEEYDRFLMNAKRIFNTRDKTNPNSLFWFAEAPRMVASPGGTETHVISAIYGLLAGFILALMGIILGRLFDTSLRSEQDVTSYLGVKVLGHVPNLGNISLEQGQISIHL